MTTFLNPADMTRLQAILHAVARELDYQNFKWSDGKTPNTHEYTAWLMIVRKELNEAMDAWATHPGIQASQQELLQVLSVCIVALMEYGVIERNFTEAFNGLDIALRRKMGEGISEKRTAIRRRVTDYGRATYQDGKWSGKNLPMMPLEARQTETPVVPKAPESFGDSIAQQVLSSLASAVGDEKKPKMVLLLGNIEMFPREMAELHKEETLKGNIVLVGDHPPVTTNTQKASMARLWKAKIRMADEVVVVNPGEFISPTTRQMIFYARSVSKPIRYLVNPIIWDKNGYLIERVSFTFDGNGTPTHSPHMRVYKDGKHMRLLSQKEVEELPDGAQVTAYWGMGGVQSITVVKLPLGPYANGTRRLWKVGNQPGSYLVWKTATTLTGTAHEIGEALRRGMEERLEQMKGDPARFTREVLRPPYDSLMRMAGKTRFTVPYPDAQKDFTHWRELREYSIGTTFWVSLQLDGSSGYTPASAYRISGRGPDHIQLTDMYDHVSIALNESTRFIAWLPRTKQEQAVETPVVTPTPSAYYRDGYQFDKHGGRWEVRDRGSLCSLFTAEELRNTERDTQITVRWGVQRGKDMPAVATYRLGKNQIGDLWAVTENKEWYYLGDRGELVGPEPHQINVWRTPSTPREITPFAEGSNLRDIVGQVCAGRFGRSIPGTLTDAIIEAGLVRIDGVLVTSPRYILPDDRLVHTLSIKGGLVTTNTLASRVGDIPVFQFVIQPNPPESKL